MSPPSVLLARVLLPGLIVLAAPATAFADDAAAPATPSASAPAAATEPAAAEPAADSRARVGSFGVSIGTGGIGVDYAYPLHRFFDIRVGYDFGKLSYDFEEDSDDGQGEPIEYQADLKFSSGRLLIDYKPFGGGFRISAGLYTGTPEIEGRSDGALDEVELGDSVYNIEGNVFADADIGGSAPYLGIGWGGTAGTRGFGVSFDLGVLFADAPSFDVAVSGRACDASQDENCDPNGAEGFDPTTDPDFQDEIERERAELEDDAKDFDLWPIVRLGLHYRF